MIEWFWKFPGWIWAIGYLCWLFVGPRIGLFIGIAFDSVSSEEGRTLGLSLTTLPLFGWLALCGHKLRFVGRPWYGKHMAPMLLIVWFVMLISLYFFLGTQRKVMEADVFVMGVFHLVFLVSLIVAYDQVVFGIVNGERKLGIKRSGYLYVLLVTLFPPFAMAFVHPRAVALVEKLK